MMEPRLAPPVHVPDSCAPGTCVPLLLSSVNVTCPPSMREDGMANRTNGPPAEIGTGTVLPAPDIVRVGPEVVLPPDAIPFVVTVACTQPLASVTSGITPPPATPSSVPLPAPRL